MSEFVFLYPKWFWALIPITVMTLWLLKRKRHKSLIAPHLAKAMGANTRHTSKHVPHLFAVSCFIAIVALAGPSFSKAERPSYSNSSVRVLVMDMSLSLYANDIKPNRLTMSRYKAIDLLKLWSDGQTGLVVYSGDAYLASPLTSDSNTLINIIPNLSPKIMPYQGANATAAIKLALDTISSAGFDQGDIVLFSDDIETSEANEIEQMLNDVGYRLTILGIGTQPGAPIRLEDGALLRTDAGVTPVAKVPFKLMQQIAQSTGGIFVPIQADNSDIETIARLTNQVSNAQANHNSQTISDRINHGYW
ncbi:MAG TPA: hypothetical protein DCS35_09030, partial [Vibrio sp.]|nr:hypothetical protein [Vibrio sp.]